MYFPGKYTGVGCHAFLQAIFPTQGLNPRLLYLLRWQVGSHFLLQGLSAAQGWTHSARTSSLALAGGFLSTRASGEQTFVKKTEKEKHWLPELKCSKSPRVTVTVFNEETDRWK